MTTDFHAFLDIRRFDDSGSAMKTRSFTDPKHGSIAAITSGEGEAAGDILRPTFGSGTRNAVITVS